MALLKLNLKVWCWFGCVNNESVKRFVYDDDGYFGDKNNFDFSVVSKNWFFSIFLSVYSGKYEFKSIDDDVESSSFNGNGCDARNGLCDTVNLIFFKSSVNQFGFWAAACWLWFWRYPPTFFG